MRTMWQRSLYFSICIYLLLPHGVVSRIIADSKDDAQQQRSSNLLPDLPRISAGKARTVCCGHQDHRLACKEMVRYLYMTTGYLPSMVIMQDTVRAPSIPMQCRKDAIVLMENNHLYTRYLQRQVRHEVELLHTEGHHTRLTSWTVSNSSSVLLVVGGSLAGVKHGAYELLERYGLAFRIEGDIVPDMSLWTFKPQSLLSLKITGTPTFDVRGLNPFDAYPEGPDWWGQNQFKAVFSQLSKMRMNFLGLHAYPYSAKQGTGHDEPTVWVGLKEDVNPDGSLKQSYPTSYANSMRGQWGFPSVPTGQYHYGAKHIFPTDCYGNEVQIGNCPYPTTMAGNNEVFAKTGQMLKASFEHAHHLQVQTCFGTETPLSYPAPRTGMIPLNLYYSKTRNDHFLTATKCAECEGLYTFVGIEGYISAQPQDGLVPINTYWNNKETDSVLSTKPIEGYSFIRTDGYVNATHWLGSASHNEDMNSLQIFFNTKIVDHLVAANPATKQYALANGYVLQSTVAMVMSNSSYKPPNVQDYYEGAFTRIMNLGIPIDYYWAWTPESWEWGKMTENNTIFQEAVNDLKAAAAARDTLKAPFNLSTAGWVVGPLPDRSIFDKVLPLEYASITSIDMQLGNSPVDKAYMNITRHKKWAIPWMEDDKALSSTELWVNRTLQHMEDAAEYGCSGLLGLHWRTKAPSPQISAMAMKSWNPSLTSMEFWMQWSKMEFGTEELAATFISIDSYNLPELGSWNGGPGGWSPSIKQCSVGSTYLFIDKMAAMRPFVQGAANLERFDYWLNSFLYMRGISLIECTWALYNSAVTAAKKIADAEKRAVYARKEVLPVREQLVANASLAMSHLLQTVSSLGEMGTVMNALTRSLLRAIDEQTAPLEAMLKPVMPSLPASALPPDQYVGPARLIVPTFRSILTAGEDLTLQAILLLNGSLTEQCTVTLNWKLATDKPYDSAPMANIGRQMYQGQVSLAEPAVPATPYLYYVSAICPSIEEVLVWPRGAPLQATQSLVVD